VGVPTVTPNALATEKQEAMYAKRRTKCILKKWENGKNTGVLKKYLERGNQSRRDVRGN
jgi:hypothetical protein